MSRRIVLAAALLAMIGLAVLLPTTAAANRTCTYYNEPAVQYECEVEAAREAVEEFKRQEAEAKAREAEEAARREAEEQREQEAFAAEEAAREAERRREKRELQAAHREERRENVRHGREWAHKPTVTEGIAKLYAARLMRKSEFSVWSIDCEGGRINRIRWSCKVSIFYHCLRGRIQVKGIGIRDQEPWYVVHGGRLRQCRA
jgi:hypothetical protein